MTLTYDFDIHCSVPKDAFQGPAVGALLQRTVGTPNARRNYTALFRDPATVEALMGADAPLRALFEASGFGLSVGDSDYKAGYFDGLTEVARNDAIARLSQNIPNFPLKDANLNGFDFTAFLDCVMSAQPVAAEMEDSPAPEAAMPAEEDAAEQPAPDMTDADEAADADDQSLAIASAVMAATDVAPQEIVPEPLPAEPWSASAEAVAVEMPQIDEGIDDSLRKARAAEAFRSAQADGGERETSLFARPALEEAETEQAVAADEGADWVEVEADLAPEEEPEELDLTALLERVDATAHSEDDAVLPDMAQEPEPDFAPDTGDDADDLAQELAEQVGLAIADQDPRLEDAPEEVASEPELVVEDVFEDEVQDEPEIALEAEAEFCDDTEAELNAGEDTGGEFAEPEAVAAAPDVESDAEPMEAQDSSVSVDALSPEPEPAPEGRAKAPAEAPLARMERPTLDLGAEIVEMPKPSERMRIPPKPERSSLGLPRSANPLVGLAAKGALAAGLVLMVGAIYVVGFSNAGQAIGLAEAQNPAPDASAVQAMQATMQPGAAVSLP